MAALSASSIFVAFTFDRSFIIGTSSYWQSQVDDVTQYIAGFNMFFTAPWRFPLLAFDNLNYPDGTRVTFVDAIPLFALVLKVILPTSLAPFNPFGLWVSLCFILQGTGAWWIARTLRKNSWAFLIALVAVLLTFPALMARLGHISLMSHWLLLFAIALYIQSHQRSALPKWSWTIFLIAAFYINIYLFAMSSGFMLAALFSLRRGIVLDDVLTFFLPFALLAASLFITLFPLPDAGITREGGFGHYSMNLLAPLIGGKLFALHATEAPGQYEGFNYLGLGVLVGLGSTFLFKEKLLKDAIQNHKALIFILIIYATYALSNQIYFGSQKILTLSYPGVLNGITSQFRVSGRFFWPVGYCIVIYVFVFLHRRLDSRTFVLAATLLTGLQLADLEDRYKIMRATALRTSPQPMDYSKWDLAIRGDIKTLYFYPKFKCGSQPFETLMPVMRYAAERNLKLNTGYIARYSPDCQDVKSEIKGSQFEHSAYIFANADYPKIEDIIALFPENLHMRCSEIQFARVCVSAH